MLLVKGSKQLKFIKDSPGSASWHTPLTIARVQTNAPGASADFNNGTTRSWIKTHWL